MTSQETVPRRPGCPHSPAKAWQNCKKPELRRKCLFLSFLIFVSPPVLQSYTSPGPRGLEEGEWEVQGPPSHRASSTGKVEWG